MSDAGLIEAVRAGDQSAFEELYRRYRPEILSFVRRRVRDEGLSEDLTQEAFLSALRRLRETDSEVAFRPWIYEIARNATIDHFRRQARADEVSVDSGDNLRPGDHLRLVSDQGPERELAAKQRLESLRGALAELSDKHERILVMRELEGLSYRQIGEQMELTRPGVESTLFRARRRLEREFADLETGRRCLTVRGSMGRLAQGLDPRGERGRVARHVRRCTPCRATARELGFAPEKPSRAARAAAFLPLPAFLVRRLGAPSGLGAELAGAIGAKGTALVAALALAGGGAGLGTLSVPHSRGPSGPPDAGPSAVPRAKQPELPAAPGPAPSSRPAASRPPVGEARVKPRSGLAPREAPAPALPLEGLESGSPELPALRTDRTQTPEAAEVAEVVEVEGPLPPAGSVERPSVSVLDNEGPGLGGVPSEDPSPPLPGGPGPEAPVFAPATPSVPSAAPVFAQHAAPTGAPDGPPAAF